MYKRPDSPTRRVDLSGAQLRDADLREVSLYDADLTDADLTNANLTGADLHGAVLSGAVLRGANLQGAKLRAVDMSPRRQVEPRGAWRIWKVPTSTYVTKARQADQGESERSRPAPS